MTVYWTLPCSPPPGLVGWAWAVPHLPPTYSRIHRARHYHKVLRV